MIKNIFLEISMFKFLLLNRQFKKLISVLSIQT